MKTDEVATPLESVVSASVAVPFMKTPPGPEEGAVKVTGTPLAGDPLNVTVTANGAANAAPTVALCEVPLVAVVAKVGAEVFVRSN